MAIGTPYTVPNSAASNPPNTLTKTSHSLTIIFHGKPIGLINTWNPQQQREITPIYELNVETSGLPYENIPGNVKGLQITVNRYDLWKAPMETAFGVSIVSSDMLSNQQAPFSVQERWTAPNGTTETWSYNGCWMSNVGRNMQSTDARIVNVNATLVYLYKSRVG